MTKSISVGGAVAHVPTDVRRQQFIDAAVTVIARVGVDGATTRRIAEEAGAPLATLHYCFQTKENLLWAVFEQIADLMRPDPAEGDVRANAKGQTVSSIATSLLTEAIQWAIARPAENRTQIEIWLWAERNDPELAVKLYGLYIDLSKDLLRAAKNPLPDDQLETVTRVIVSIADGLCMQLITHGDEKMILRELATASAMLDAYLGRRSRRIA
ncbi:TetR/AcrR family transcriptional regulator [Marmoricola sp. URHB0036]|uniref:TetR/AcrR family transcriptional regulator n=1 Tax=Marmoricola sp. URHB0036 TaxID=1298863 RepID=UPI0009DC1129|nr:TetR/AcrR family transcriptional regulator [Marmoricola sp. URHB0036]